MRMDGDTRRLAEAMHGKTAFEPVTGDGFDRAALTDPVRVVGDWLGARSTAVALDVTDVVDAPGGGAQ